MNDNDNGSRSPGVHYNIVKLGITYNVFYINYLCMPRFIFSRFQVTGTDMLLGVLNFNFGMIVRSEGPKIGA